MEPAGVEFREKPSQSPFQLQTPREFRDDFVTSAAHAKEEVGLETMQFEVCDDTQPIFDTLKSAIKRGLKKVRFHYDRMTNRSIRSGDSESLLFRSRLFRPRGNRDDLQQAVEDRVEVLDELSADGVHIHRTSARMGIMGSPRPTNHAKIAVVDDVAWFGSMNQRELDYQISNFMIKVTDPDFVHAIKQVFDDTEHLEAGRQISCKKEDGRSQYELLVDTGIEENSRIYDRALSMLDGVGPGDEITFISQWPAGRVLGPIVYGKFQGVLREKANDGARVRFLISPEDKLHPLGPWASRMAQRDSDRRFSDMSNFEVINLARQTHAKALVIKHKDGSKEALFGSHNLGRGFGRVREVSMWAKDAPIVDQVAAFLDDVQKEAPK